MTYREKQFHKGYSSVNKRELQNFIKRKMFVGAEIPDERSNPKSECFDPLAVIKEKL